MTGWELGYSVGGGLWPSLHRGATTFWMDRIPLKARQRMHLADVCRKRQVQHIPFCGGGSGLTSVYASLRDEDRLPPGGEQYCTYRSIVGAPGV